MGPDGRQSSALVSALPQRSPERQRNQNIKTDEDCPVHLPTAPLLSTLEEALQAHRQQDNASHGAATDCELPRSRRPSPSPQAEIGMMGGWVGGGWRGWGHEKYSESPERPGGRVSPLSSGTDIKSGEEGAIGGAALAL